MKNFTHFYFFFQKVIMVLIMLGLHKAFLNSCLPYSCSYLLKQLCVNFICPSSWLCSRCLHSCYSSKLTFLMFSKLVFLLLFLDTILLLFSIAFLLLQVHVLIAILSRVLVTPSSCFCCSRLIVRILVASSS
jgi:hypothetical protein